MTSTKERQRAAARARLEREMAQRQAAARKRRQRQAMVGAGVALLLVVLGSVWLISSVGDDDGTPSAGPSDGVPDTTCVWNEVPAEGRPATLKDVGTPPTGTEPRTGTQVMTVTTNHGTFEVTMDLTKVPCTAASMAFLAGKQFYDGSKCHRMFPGMLQCGDPSARGKGWRDTDGTGGPTYRFAEENLPVGQRPAYPSGTVAMAKSSEPGSTGSQFFIVYTDQELDGPNYTVLGTITKGMDVIQKATAAGHDGAFDPQPGGGHPKTDIVLQTVRVGAPQP